jgi:hypothetical protein
MLGAVALLGMLTFSSLAAVPPEVPDNPADPLKSLPAGESKMAQLPPSAEPSSQDTPGFLDRIHQLQAGRQMAAPLPPSLRPERLPTPRLYRLPVSARKRLAASVLFAIHPLLVLAPTDDVLDSPGDHPRPVNGSDWLQDLAGEDRPTTPVEMTPCFDCDRTVEKANDQRTPRWLYVLVGRGGQSCSTAPSQASRCWLQSIPPGDVVFEFGGMSAVEVREPLDLKWLLSRWLEFRQALKSLLPQPGQSGTPGSAAYRKTRSPSTAVSG